MVVIEPKSPAKYSVIWLHGLGADGHDFEPVVPQLNLPSDKHIRFIFPHAPVRPVTINAGMSMRAWYDIVELSQDAKEDEVGIRDSQRIVEELIESEIAKGIDCQNIVLAGFSQGGAIALHSGLRQEKPLAGILALSTYLPLAPTLAKEFSYVNQSTPIFMAHGKNDPVIPMEFAQASCQHLKSLGYKIDWQTYPMEHSLCMEEIGDIANWLQQVLS